MMQNTQNFPTDIIESLLTEHHDFKVDVYESNGAYQVIAELPGYSKDDVTIQFEDKTLTIRVTQTSTTTAGRWSTSARTSMSQPISQGKSTPMPPSPSTAAR